jgi:hypothetical protein
MPAGWQGGSTTAWRRTRANVFGQDGYRCRVADVLAGRHLPARLRQAQPWFHLLKVSKHCTGRDITKLTAHHIRGKRVTGDDPKFLVTACAQCNLGMGDPSASDPPPRYVTRW